MKEDRGKLNYLKPSEEHIKGGLVMSMIIFPFSISFLFILLFGFGIFGGEINPFAIFIGSIGFLSFFYYSLLFYIEKYDKYELTDVGILRNSLINHKGIFFDMTNVNLIKWSDIEIIYFHKKNDEIKIIKKNGSKKELSVIDRKQFLNVMNKYYYKHKSKLIEAD